MPASDSLSPSGKDKGVNFLTTALTSPVSPVEAALRTLSFADFTGQPKTELRISRASFFLAATED